MLKPSFSRLLASSALLLTTLAAAAPAALAQGVSSAEPKQPGGRVVLVLPFDNRSGNPNLNWIGDSFPDTLNQRLASAGFLAISRDDRQFALDHLGLPVDFRPTRATTIRIAQTLDADYVIVGSFNTQGTGAATRILVQAQVLEVTRLRLSAPLADSSELPRLFDIENAIAWKIARQIEPRFPVAEQTFLAASAGVRLSAFENYIRGTSATAPDERVKRLEVATLDAPNYAAAQLALGKQYYADRSYDKAAATLARIPSSSNLSLEAGFYLGLSRFNSTRYAEAEKAFAFVASRLPLPEVVNDQGVAQSRQNKDATALFQRAVTADPNDPDYHFNLAVATYKRGDFATATREVQAALKLRPNDAEFKELQTLIAAGRSAKSTADGFDPTTRLRRTYSEASFRQAAFQLDQMRSMRLATLPPKQQGTEYTQLGQEYMVQGLIPEAEEQFLSAIQADPNNPAAHAGLAEVRQLSDSPDDARKEALTSIRLAPSVNAYIVLARVDLGKNELAAAATDVQNGLRMEPRNALLLQLQQTVQAKSQSAPTATIPQPQTQP